MTANDDDDLVSSDYFEENFSQVFQVLGKHVEPHLIIEIRKKSF